jgi:hypothetical protein
MKILTMILAVAMLATGAEKTDKSAKKDFLDKFAAMELGPVGAAKSTPAKTAGPRDATSNTSSLTLFGAVGAFTVAPGGTYKITSSYDYTGADTLAVAVECPSGNNLQNVGVTVWWGNSLAANLTLTDVILGSDFSLSYMGGGTVPVYGSQLLLQVVNIGTITVSCDQLTTYAVVH